ncbi:MAG: penicillin-binding protein 2 [Phycisphaerales bacterium]|nr:penicillin-binding protein 2 [Phycisphaerales bacterium]
MNSLVSGSDRIDSWSRWCAATVCVGFCATVIRVAQLNLLPSPQLRPAMGSRHSSEVELAARGQILDRRGRVLATSVVGWRLFADPAWIYQQAWKDQSNSRPADCFGDAASSIASAIGKQPSEVARVLADRADSRYVVLCQDMEDWQVDGVRTAEVKGVGITPKVVRVYPQGELGARLVGRVGFEQVGLSGSELVFQKELAPANGKLTFLRDVHRRALHIDEEGYRPAEDGTDVYLTIDLVVQEIAERCLEAAVKRYNAGGGRVVVFDPETGDVLAMADILRRRAGWQEVTDDPLRRINPALGRNRCVSDPYEPGSTFKPFVWAYATEAGKADPKSIIPTPTNGPYRTSKGRVIRDVKYYGPVSWRTVLVKSLNSGMAIVGERLSFAQMQDMAKRFGFGQSTRCGLPGETIGLVTDPAHWTHYTQTSVSMGHEIGVTPLQMVRAFSAFCGDGTMPATVRLRLQLNDDGTEVPSARVRALPEAIALVAREALADVLTEGTGRKAQSTQYRMFGKSGTAQLPKPKGQGTGYFEDRYVSSFIAGAPLERPRVLVLCVIDDPDKKQGHFGGSIAGPVVRDVMDETLHYLGVRPDQPTARVNEIERLAASAGH